MLVAAHALSRSKVPVRNFIPAYQLRLSTHQRQEAMTEMMHDCPLYFKLYYLIKYRVKQKIEP